jgi:DNA-binding transcriptional LysR family regulator
VELRQLRYFVAVVEARGLRKAARVSYATPSVISRALRQLEKELEVELLHRSAAGVVPTAAGLDLLEHARSILAHADAAARAMHSHSSSESRLLRVGAVGGVLAASELTTPILSSFRAAHPAITIQPQRIWWGDQIGMLLAEELDVALLRGPVEHPGIELIPLAYEPRVLLVSADHDLAGQREVNVEAVLGEFTVRLAGPDLWSHFYQLDDVRGKSNPRSGLAPATTLREMQSAVASSYAVISTSGSIGRMVPSPHTRCIKLEGVNPSAILVARRRFDRRPSVKSFVQSAAETAQNHIALIPGGTTP